MHYVLRINYLRYERLTFDGLCSTRRLIVNQLKKCTNQFLKRYTILRTSINSHRYKFNNLQLEHAIEYATDCKHEGRKVIHQHLSALHFRFPIRISWITHAFVCRVCAYLYRISLIIIQIVQSVLCISREDRWIFFVPWQTLNYEYL